LQLLLSITYLLLILLLSPCVSAAPGQEYVIVVHQENQVNVLTSKELKRMFLGKVKRWPDGSAILLVLNPNDDVHSSFSRSLLHKSPKQLTAFWRKNLYSGRGMMPYLAENEADLLAYIDKNRNAISYLSKVELSGPLKAVKVTR